MASAADLTVKLKHQQGRESDRGHVSACDRHVSAGDHLGLTRNPFYKPQGKQIRDK